MPARFGARRGQNQQGKRHDGRHKGPRGSAQQVSQETGLHQPRREAVVLVRVFTRHLMCNRVEILGRLSHGDFGLDDADDEQPVTPALVQEIVPADLLLVHDRHPEIGPQEKLRAIKCRRRHSDDGERMLIEIDDCPDHARVCAEARTPECITQHDVGAELGPRSSLE